MHTHIHTHAYTHTPFPHTHAYDIWPCTAVVLWAAMNQDHPRWLSTKLDHSHNQLVIRTVSWLERPTQLAREPHTLDSVWVRTSTQWVYYITHKKYMCACAPGYSWHKSLVEMQIPHFFNQTPRLLLFVVVWLLFEGGVYFFGKPADINNWIRYVRVRCWRFAKHSQ